MSYEQLGAVKPGSLFSRAFGRLAPPRPVISAPPRVVSPLKAKPILSLLRFGRLNARAPNPGVPAIFSPNAPMPIVDQPTYPPPVLTAPPSGIQPSGSPASYAANAAMAASATMDAINTAEYPPDTELDEQNEEPIEVPAPLQPAVSPAAVKTAAKSLPIGLLVIGGLIFFAWMKGRR